uniref:Uncharacterized protein n=1 Tax=Rhizophagus irregularis (strain DAOM 181602 / DAOM 197198 / MUCL 43194) TaxID=747089 RepID=U9TL08_RHIID
MAFRILYTTLMKIFVIVDSFHHLSLAYPTVVVEEVVLKKVDCMYMFGMVLVEEEMVKKVICMYMFGELLVEDEMMLKEEDIVN